MWGSREEQYRQMWTELENVVVAASTTSPRHLEVQLVYDQLKTVDFAFKIVCSKFQASLM